MSRLEYGLSARFKPKKKDNSGKFVLSEEQKPEIKEAFDLFDTDKSNRLDYHQLKVSMRALGFEVRKAEVMKLMKEYDRNENGWITYNDFVEMMTEKNGRKKSRR